LYDGGVKKVRVLITGASGFVGRALVKGLRQQGEHDVIAFSRILPPDYQQLDVKWVQGDLQNEIQLNERVDYIVHCAAIQNFKDLPVRDFIDANLAMTENVARYGKKIGVKGLFFTSTVSLHGEIRENVVDEKTDSINPSLYGLSKHLCELLLQEYQEYFPVIAIRLCGVIGSGAKNVWLASVLSKAQDGEPVSIVNPDCPFNNIVHTDDLVNFLPLLMADGFAGFHAFPIASSNPLSIKNVVTEIIKSSNSNSEIIDSGVTDNSFIISNDYAMREFGYEPSDVVTNLRKFASTFI
jgi:nucleoside-diphosphate-sugar epimerase